jgi:hypothetical protein
VAAVVVALDAASYERAGRSRRRGAPVEGEPESQEQRALHFALGEYDLKVCEVHAGDSLGTVLA